jgi:hypothetical protein
MISFRRCSQRTPPKREFEHLTLCSNIVRQLLCGAQDETEEDCRLNSPLTLDLPRLKATAGRPSASSWAEIARDIHGMILGVMLGMAAESPS